MFLEEVNNSLISTLDGSYTLFSNRFNAHYHSLNGSVSETNHVFIKNGLLPILVRKSGICILEMGFGTGLNCLATISTVIERPEISINYIAFEQYKLEESMVMKLSYNSFYENITSEMVKKIHKTPSGKEVAISENVNLLVNYCDITTSIIPTNIDLIYFDAFAPDIQPELWGINFFEKLYAALIDGGVLVTYCAKGQVKRNLRAVGFSVEALPGPPGKREMTRAIKCSK